MKQQIVFLIFIGLIIIIFLSGCKTKQVVVERQYQKVVDSTLVSQKDSIISKSRKREKSYIEYITKIERELASRLKGEAGGVKDSVTPPSIKNMTLNSGRDTFYIEGVWEYLSWDWYNAPCESVTSSKKDSSVKELTSLQKKYSQLQERYDKLIESKNSYTENKKTTAPSIFAVVRWFIYGVIAGILVSFWKNIKSFFRGLFR